jgi:CheY-like chemotaxis protein
VVEPSPPQEILVIEDDPGDAFLAEEYLAEEEGEFVVRWAPSLGKGVEMLDQRTTCVLLDLGLPDAQGVDAVRRLRVAAPLLPIVVLTGFGDREAGLTAVAAGAQDYLVKGEVTPASLGRSIRYAVARRGNEDRDLRLLEADLRREENRRLALGLQPHLRVRDPELVCTSLYRPAGGDNLLGGDFLDAIELDDGTVRLVLGDVAGHGPEEAALGVALRVGWRGLVLAELGECDTLCELEKLLVVERSHPHAFATVADVTIAPDRRSMHVCLAGHPAPLLGTGGPPVPVDVPALRPMGVPGDGLTATEVPLPDRWSLLLYSDGVFEGRLPEGGRMGLDDFHGGVAAAAGRGPWTEEQLAALVERSERAHGGPLDDDVALLACARVPR